MGLRNPLTLKWSKKPLIDKKTCFPYFLVVKHENTEFLSEGIFIDQDILNLISFSEC